MKNVLSSYEFALARFVVLCSGGMVLWCLFEDYIEEDALI